MITIRFPTGLSLQYNDLYHVDCRDSLIYLKQSKDSGWSVAVDLSSGAIVEFSTPCRSYNCIGDKDGVTMQTVVDAIPKIQAKISKLSTAERKRRKK